MPREIDFLLCIKARMHKNLVYEVTLPTFFLCETNLRFESITVIPFQYVVLDNTEVILFVQGRGSTQNQNSTGYS